ncbi:hypothetical protein C0992_004874 [Termitomyces sp. T32_za158]|nr:hypothetical protein C0992_004874 [Termitomyces sp. T32_za158]
MPAGGSAFTLEGDPETIAAYLAMKGASARSDTLPKQEFAGLAADTVPMTSSLVKVEDLEIYAWIMLEEEPRMDDNHI